MTSPGRRDRPERIPAAIATAAWAAAVIAAAGVAVAAPPAAVSRVTYLAGGSVYVGAGRSEGLAEGDTLWVVRDERTVAGLRVTFLSTHSASCDTFAVAARPQVGDAVRFRARPAEAAQAQAAADTLSVFEFSDAPADSVAPSPPSSARAMRPRAEPGNVMRGRVGVRFLAVQSELGSDFNQPALDLRLDGTDMAGSSLDFAADLRGRRTTRIVDGASQVEARTSVYRLSAAVHDAGGRRRLTLGRQSSPTLAAVSLFDGALAEVGGERWTAGLFGGSQPEPTHLRVSGDILEHGGFLEWRQAPLAARRWSVALGGVGSYENGELNRNFLFAQAFYRDARFSTWVTQEVDINSGWKRTAGEDLLAPTSTFVTASAQLPRGFALRAGYDSRRNVRLYRDRETPQTEFDDRLRRGAWAGASVRLWDRLRLGGDGRLHDAAGERGTSWSASAETWRLLVPGARALASYSRYRDDRTETWLLAGRLGADPLPWAHLGVGGGTRNSTDRLSGLESPVRWLSADLELGLPHRLLFTGTLERTLGDFENLLQEYAGLSWRF
jgi:hypothetical protein